MNWYKKVRKQLSLFRFNGWLISIILIGFFSISLFWWMYSPYYSLYVLNRALQEQSITKFLKICDIDSLTHHLSKELMIYTQSEALIPSFIDEVVQNHDRSTADLQLFFERLIHDFVTKGDYSLPYSNSTHGTIRQYLALHSLYLDVQTACTKLTQTRHSATAYLPFYDQNHRCVLHLHLIFEKEKNARWVLKKVTNISALILWIQDHPIVTDDVRYKNNESLLDEVMDKPFLFPLFYSSTIRYLETYLSYSFRSTHYHYVGDVLETTEYILYEKNHEGDLRFKYVQDDSMGCTIDKREIYYVQDNIYYHHSAQEGWMRIDEKSASLHKIQPPTEYLTSMIVNEPPDEVTSFTKDEIDSSHALFRYWKCKEFETVIQCDWKQKDPLQWLLFFTADNHLIGGLFENFSPGSKKVSTMLFERINEEFSFHLDTIVEP